MKQQYKTNLIGPSPIDDRDFKYSLRALRPEALPKSLLLIDDDIPERDQGGYGSCAAQVAAFIHSYHEKVEKGSWIEFSPAFTYALRMDHIYDRSEETLPEGMYPRDLLRIMLHIGCVLEEDLPYVDKHLRGYDIFKDKERLKGLFETSVKYRIKEYSKVAKSKELIKEALCMSGPLLIAVPVFNYGGEMWLREDDDQEMIGGHAMAVIGYDEEGIIIRNSWGTKWNKDGTCKMRWEHIGEAWEFWATTDETFDPENVRPVPDRAPEDNVFPDKAGIWERLSEHIPTILVVTIASILALLLVVHINS